jgi:4-amino-4-deoxy-L-arabinose transferase-like glycosyltransferase
MKLSTRTWLAAFVAVGLSLRLGLAIKLGLNEPPPPGSDQHEFDTYAWNLAQGHGYRGLSPDVSDQDHLTAYRVPGTSVSWAVLYQLFGHRYDVARIFHCIVGAFTVLLVYGIGRRCFDERVAVLASALFAVYPVALLYSVDLVSEPLATLWLLWFVYASLQFAEKPTFGRAVWAGLLLGCSLLTRASSVFMVPLVGIWALWQFRKRPRELGLALCIPVVSVLTLLPWTARNYRVFGKFIPLSTQGGSALLQGNNDIVATNPAYYGFSVWDTKINDDITRQLKAPNEEYERDRTAQRLAIEWLKEHRDKWGYLVQAKFRRSWTPFLQQPSRSRRLGMLVIWGPILVLFAASFFPTLMRFLREGHSGWMIHLAILHYAINSIIFFALVRYRYPIEALCVILACATVVWVSDKLRRRHQSSIA